jgi:putative ABC transport system permease protein
MSLITDLKSAVRSLARAKGLTFTVVLTLAPGIGANAAIFSVVRGVLLRPLVNRDPYRLIYIRQSAKGARHGYQLNRIASWPSLPPGS